MGAMGEAEAKQNMAAEKILIGDDVAISIEQLEIHIDAVRVRECLMVSRIQGRRSRVGGMIRLRLDGAGNGKAHRER